MKELLGGKEPPWEMVNIGLPVPAGFTIKLVCYGILQNNKKYPKLDKQSQRRPGRKVEKEMGAKFGDFQRTRLLVSVRSGARASMPGMMETILNVGLNNVTKAKALIRQDR